MIRHPRAPSAIVIIEGGTPPRAKRKISKLSYFQGHLDLTTTAHDNLIDHISCIGKESKDKKRDLSKSKVIVLKTEQIEALGSRKVVRTSVGTRLSKSRKNGKHLENMSQGIKKDLEKGCSRSKTIKYEQTKSLGVFPFTRNMIKE